MTIFTGKWLAVAAFVAGLAIPSICVAQTEWHFEEHWKWGEIADVNQRGQIETDVHASVARQDFAALDALAAEFRGSGGLTPSGSSKLSFFYEVLIYEVGHLAPFDTCRSGGQTFLEKWQAASPRAPTPLIARAELLEADAWCHRGTNSSDKVATDSWKPFHDNIEAAVLLLEQNRAVASEDPEFYAEYLSLAIVYPRLQEKFKALLDEASGRFPYYHGIYFTAYRYYQPQWFGSPAEIEALARYAADKTKARDGMTGYFRVYWNIVQCKCYRDLESMDWPTMQTAMLDFTQRYPVDWAYLFSAQMSCLRGKAEDAATYFSKLAINDARSWSKDDWDWCRQFVGPSAQPFPLGAP